MMSEKKAVLSAFVDEETSELEVRRLCKELLSDQHELARWSRYHLIRDTLRGNLPAIIDPNFSTTIMARLEREPTLADAALLPWRERLLHPTARLGLAASIAVAAVLGFQAFTGDSTPSPQIAQVAQISAPLHRVKVQTGSVNRVSDRSPAERTLSQNPEIAARLNSYLVNHSEYAPSQGMMPYARVVVGYDQVEQ